MGLTMKYFVLKPKGNNLYAMASRDALRAYARRLHLSEEDETLAFELERWAARENEFHLGKKE